MPVLLFITNLQVYILSNHHWYFIPETGRGWREVQQEVTMHKGGNLRLRKTPELKSLAWGKTFFMTLWTCPNQRPRPINHTWLNCKCLLKYFCELLLVLLKLQVFHQGEVKTILGPSIIVFSSTPPPAGQVFPSQATSQGPLPFSVQRCWYIYIFYICFFFLLFRI